MKHVLSMMLNFFSPFDLVLCFAWHQICTVSSWQSIRDILPDGSLSWTAIRAPETPYQTDLYSEQLIEHQRLSTRHIFIVNIWRSTRDSLTDRSVSWTADKAPETLYQTDLYHEQLLEHQRFPTRQIFIVKGWGSTRDSLPDRSVSWTADGALRLSTRQICIGNS